MYSSRKQQPFRVCPIPPSSRVVGRLRSLMYVIGPPGLPFLYSYRAILQSPSDGGLNASLTLATTGINSNANCSIPLTINLDTSSTNNYTITARDSDGCTSIAAFNPANADQQYGTTPAEPGTCGLDPGLDVSFGPLMFWFFHTSNNGTRQARAVMCRPNIQLFNVVATVYLTNSSLAEVTIIDNDTAPNSITGTLLDGKAYNACVPLRLHSRKSALTRNHYRVLFNQSSLNDFVKARAVAIQSQIPGAIFRFASQDPNILQQTFDSPAGFLLLTERIYVRTSVAAACSVFTTIIDATSCRQRKVCLLPG